MKTIIIDDEPKARENLTCLLKDNCPSVKIVDDKGTVNEGLLSIKKHQPDLLFLDVQMCGETGFDLLEQLKTINFEVIFTTAHHEYALKAFKFSAVDYLLKPIVIDELKDAVYRASKSTAQQSHTRIQMITETIKNQQNGFDKIALPSADGFLFVKRDDIIRCESTDNYTNFYLNNGSKIMVSKTLKHFDDLLSPHNFFRVHQSHLINLIHLKQYHKGEGGYAIMSDDSSVMVSRRKKAEFLDRLSQI